MRARIFQQPKTATQSGTAGTHEWLLQSEPTEPRRQDALMGWFGSGDMQSQVTLRFDTQDEAVAYATKSGIDFDLELPPVRVRVPKIYADNFKYGRLDNWTH
jgi:hypothetical protein